MANNEINYSAKVKVGDELWAVGFSVANGGRGQKLTVNLIPTHFRIEGFDRRAWGPHSLYSVDNITVIEGDSKKCLTTIQRHQATFFKTKDEAVEYYNEQIKAAIEYKTQCIAALQADVERFSKYEWKDGQPPKEVKVPKVKVTI